MSIPENLFTKELFQPVPYVKGTKQEKLDFYNGIVSEGGEGIILRSLKDDYAPVENRGSHIGSYYNPNSKSYNNRVRMLKIKRSVCQSVGDTIDAFVSGYSLGTPGTANEGLVSSLDLSVYLMPSGEQKVIASVANLPLELQKKITVLDESGNPIMADWFYNKVYPVDGQDFSSKQLKFVHPRVENWGVDNLGRPDKSPMDCIFNSALLNDLVL